MGRDQAGRGSKKLGRNLPMAGKEQLIWQPTQGFFLDLHMTESNLVMSNARFSSCPVSGQNRYAQAV